MIVVILYSMNVWWSKTFPVCCLSLFVSQDIVEIWIVKFGEPPVIHQIRQGFPLPKNHTIRYILYV